MYKNLIKNTGYATIAQASSVVLALLETVLFTRYFSQELFGLYVLAIASSTFVYEFIDMRTQEAAVRYIPLYMHAKSNLRVGAVIKALFLITFATGVIASLLMYFAAYPMAAYLFKDARLESIFPYTIINLLPIAISRPAGSVLRAVDKMNLSTIYGILGNVVRIVATVMVVLIQCNVRQMLFLKGCAEWIASALLIAIVFVEMHKRGVHIIRAPLSALRGTWKEMFVFLTNASLSSTLKVIGTKFDVSLVGMYCKLEVVAMYKVATRLAGLVLMITDPLYIAIFPEYSNFVAQKRFNDIKKMSRKITTISLSMGIAILLTYVVFGESIISVTVGAMYLPIYFPVLIISAGILCQASFFWARPLLLCLGKSYALTISYVIAVVLQFSILLAFLNEYGLYAASGALAVMYICFVLTELFWIRRHFLLGKVKPISEHAPTTA